MRRVDCDLEQAVIQAVGSNQRTSQLRAHIKDCVHCRDAVRASRVLQGLRAMPEPLLPSAGFVWWQSRIRQRRAAQRRVTRFIAITQIATLATSLIGVAVWVIRHWLEVSDEMRSLLNSVSTSYASSLATSGDVLVYLSLALLAVNLLLTVRAFVTRAKTD